MSGQHELALGQLRQKYGAKINISDDGLVKIRTAHPAHAQDVKTGILELVRDFATGDICEGVVMQVLEFYGAILELPCGQRGLLHISHLLAEEAGAWQETLVPGHRFRVQVIGQDRTGQFQLSRLGMSMRAEEGARVSARGSCVQAIAPFNVVDRKQGTP